MDLRKLYFEEHASFADLNVDVHEHAPSQSIPASNTVIHAKTIVQPPGHFDDTITSVRRQPQYITPPALNITGRCSDGKETQTDIDATPEPDDDTKTEPDDDAKTEPDDGINEKDVNAEVLAHAILDIPLPPAIVASVQLLGQRKRRNSCCCKGITRMRAKRRQMTTVENEEGGNGGIRAHRTRLNHLSRPSPYASVPWRRKGYSKGLQRWYCSSDLRSSDLHSQANVPSDEISQTSAVVSGDNSLSCSPFILSIRGSSKLHGLESIPAQGVQRRTPVPTPSRRRSRDKDSHHNTSSELRNKERPLKQTRVKGGVGQTKDFTQPPANPIPDKKRPPVLRRATGYGSAGSRHRAHHSTNGDVQVRINKLDVMRRARLITISPTSRHAHTLRPPHVVS